MGSLQYLDSGLDRGLDSGLDHGLTAFQALISQFYYNVTGLLIYTRFDKDTPHLNYIYNKYLMKSFHGADANDDSD